MPKRRSDIRAGLFIVAAAAAAAGIVIGIKGVGTVFAEETVRTARFSLADDIGGLRVGDEVRIGGFKVGVVRDIAVEGIGSGTEPYLAVRFAMAGKYPVATDADLSVQPSLTGTTVLNFDRLGTGPSLPPGQPIPGHPGALNALLAQLGGAGPDVRQIVSTIRSTTLPKIDATVDELPATVASYHQTSDRARAAIDTAGSIFGDTKPDIRGTMANLHSLTDTARTRLPAMLDRASALIDQANTTIADARGTMADLKATAANTRQLTASARDVVVNNRTKFDNVIAGLKQTGDNLSQATAEIRRNPWRLLYKPGPGEMDNLALYDAARQFSDGANHVDDAAAALRDALRNPDVSRDQLQKLVGRLDEAMGKFNGVEQKLWTTVKQ